MEKNNKAIIYFAVILPIIAGFVFYIRHNRGEFAKILSLDFIDFAIISCLVIATILLNGMIIKVLVEFFKLKLRMAEWFGLSVVNTLGNYLPLKIGFVLRAVYLKKAHNFPYTAFLSSMGVAYLIIILSSGFIGMLGMVAMYFVRGAFNLILFLFCAAIFSGGLFLIAFSPRVKPSENKLIRRIVNAIDGWNLIKKDRTLLLKLFCINVLLIFVYAFRVYYASAALGYDFPFLYALLIGIPAMLSIFLIFIPAGIGVREAVMGFSSKLLEQSALSGVVIGSLDRIVAMAWVIVLGSIFAAVLSKNADFQNK